jgi:hypothetical protein
MCKLLVHYDVIICFFEKVSAPFSPSIMKIFLPRTKVHYPLVVDTNELNTPCVVVIVLFNNCPKM